MTKQQSTAHNLVIFEKGTHMNMQQASMYTAPNPQSGTSKVLSIHSAKRASSMEKLKLNIKTHESKRFEVRLSKNELPLTVQYDDKTYILVLTKSNKLLLQKPLV